MKGPGDHLRAGRAFLKANWRLFDSAGTDQARKVPAPPQEKPAPQGARLVDLVGPADLTVGGLPLAEAIRRRQSRRKYTAEPLSLEEVSFLLYATQGVRLRRDNYSFRTVPSAGARHSLETYLFAARVSGVDPGLYRYLPFADRLCLLASRPGLAEAMDEALMGQLWKSAAVFVWTSIPYRMEWRYTTVAHKVIALDAGHVCQNLYLACESIGCGACAIGAYDQEKMDSLLGVDGEDELAVYAAVVGKV
jgi:SagB-type dehydrogenase family enzyme